MAKAWMLAALAAAMMCGCTASQGPIVRDVTVGADGKVMVERCYLKLTHYSILIDVMPMGMSWHDCETKPAGSPP